MTTIFATIQDGGWMEADTLELFGTIPSFAAEKIHWVESARWGKVLVGFAGRELEGQRVINALSEENGSFEKIEETTIIILTPKVIWVIEEGATRLSDAVAHNEDWIAIGTGGERMHALLKSGKFNPVEALGVVKQCDIYTGGETEIKSFKHDSSRVAKSFLAG